MFDAIAQAADKMMPASAASPYYDQAKLQQLLAMTAPAADGRKVLDEQAWMKLLNPLSGVTMKNAAQDGYGSDNNGNSFFTHTDGEYQGADGQFFRQVGVDADGSPLIQYSNKNGHGWDNPTGNAGKDRVQPTYKLGKDGTATPVSAGVNYQGSPWVDYGRTMTEMGAVLAGGALAGTALAGAGGAAAAAGAGEAGAAGGGAFGGGLGLEAGGLGGFGGTGATTGGLLAGETGGFGTAAGYGAGYGGATGLGAAEAGGAFDVSGADGALNEAQGFGTGAEGNYGGAPGGSAAGAGTGGGFGSTTGGLGFDGIGAGGFGGTGVTGGEILGGAGGIGAGIGGGFGGSVGSYVQPSWWDSLKAGDISGALKSGGSSAVDYLTSKDGLSLLGGIANGLIGSSAASKAADQQAQAVREANALRKYMYDTTRGDQAPYRATGEVGATGMRNLLANPGAITADPSYKFGLDQGTQAIQRNAGAKGGYYSGATLKALERYGQDYGSTKLNDAYGRYGDAARLGEAATANVGAAGTNYANSAGADTVGAGNAAAASTLYGSNSWMGGINNALASLNRSTYQPSTPGP